MIIYSKFNNSRKKTFQLITKIEEDDGFISVTKESLYQESNNFLNSLIDKYNFLIKNNFCFQPIKPIKISNSKVKFKYINKPTLDYLLFYYLKNKDKDNFIKLIDNYYQKIIKHSVNKKIYSTEYKKIFGETNSNYKAKALTNGCLDLNFDNIIINNNKWILIDYEWVFEKIPIPIKYIFFRAITSFYNSYIEYNPNLFISINYFFKEYNITKTDQIKFIKYEYNFQKYVNKGNFLQNTSLTKYKENYNLLINNYYKQNYLIKIKDNLTQENKKLRLDLNKIQTSKTYKLWQQYNKIKKIFK